MFAKINLKKVFLIIALLIIFLGLGFISQFLKERKTTPSPEMPIKENVSIPTPVIPKTFKGESDLKFEIDEKSIKIPETSPYISFIPQAPFTEQQALSLAKGFGLSNYNFFAEDVERGKTYFWTNNDFSLIVYSKSNEIVYTANIDLSRKNKQLSNDAIIKTAKNFLIEKRLFKEEELFFSFITYMDVEFDEIYITSKEKANAYKVSFSPIKTDYKLVTLNPQNSPINVWVATDGTIIKVEIKYLGDIKLSDESYILKNLQDIKNEIKNFVIVSLDDGNIYPGDLSKNDLQDTTVNSLELAYLVDFPNNLIQPIFLLNGKTKLATTDREINVVFYLPAIK